MKNFEITFKINKDIDDLFKCFNAESQKSEWQRGKLSIKKNRQSLKFNISAKDFTALKSLSYSFLKLLETYYKLKKID